MIQQWRRVDAAEYAGSWDGHSLRLVWEKTSWRLYVDNKLVRGEWSTPIAAQREVEAVQSKLLKQKMQSNKEGVQCRQLAHA
jgi:hypothetical protein